MRLAAEHRNLLKGLGPLGTNGFMPILSMNRLTYLALGLLVLVAATSLGGILGIIRKNAPVEYLVVWCACGSLVVMAIVMMLLGKARTQRSLQVVEQRLRRLIQEGRLDDFGVAIPEEMRPVMAALCEYVDQVRDRVDHLTPSRFRLAAQV